MFKEGGEKFRAENFQLQRNFRDQQFAKIWTEECSASILIFMPQVSFNWGLPEKQIARNCEACAQFYAVVSTSSYTCDLKGDPGFRII